MNKKILDVAVVCILGAYFITTANVHERTQKYVLSEYSFTTESDETEAVEDKAMPAGLAEPVNPEEAKEEEMLMPDNRWNIRLNEEEVDLLAQIVWLESRGEPQEGQEAVVEVIFNRMASEQYPDTIYDVLSQQHPVQFCSWKNRNIAKPTEKEYQSIRNVLEGKTNILRNDTLYFSTEPLTQNLDCRIGGHCFCY